MRNRFFEDLKDGQFKEDIVLNILNKAYSQDGVTDNLKKEHDIKLTDNCFCEVKSDKNTYNTNNLWIEYCGNIKENKEGWIQYCDADILAYATLRETNVFGLFARDFYYRITNVHFIDFKGLQKYVMQKYFDGNFSNPVSFFAVKREKENEKAILIPIEEIRELIICEFSTLESKEIYHNPNYPTLQSYVESIGKNKNATSEYIWL